MRLITLSGMAALSMIPKLGVMLFSNRVICKTLFQMQKDWKVDSNDGRKRLSAGDRLAY
jgi:hypothetical protein